MVMIMEDLRYYIVRANDEGLLKWMPDKHCLYLLYWARTGKRLNLKNPQTFNEKMQWLKLNYRKPEFGDMVDKYEAKKFMADRVGEEHIIPTLGVWDRFDDIDFDVLPDQFVLKCTHDSGGLVVVRDKSKLDMAEARKKIEQSLKNNWFYHGREWPYKHIKPRIIAENYIEDLETGELRDYKWYCFNGVPKLMAIVCGRSVKAVTADFFDCSFNYIDLRCLYPKAKVAPEKPKTFDQMCEFAGILSRNVPFMRVDFYEANGHCYVGEMTFYHGSGFDLHEPKEWEDRLGTWLELPQPEK